MDHFVEIYRHQAGRYHQMIEPEDVDGHLLPALKRITPVAGKRILDLGSGTGRLPLLLAGDAAQMVCLDLHAGMLAEQRGQRQRRAGRWALLQADIRRLPLPAAWFDVVTAGWAIGHFVGWYGSARKTEIGRALREMHRVVRPGGALIIIETLSTGRLTPTPPTKGLAHYYAWLEREWGFSRQQIQTDYLFGSVEEAVAKTEFFFGPELAQNVRRHNWRRLPEWTGIWGKVVS